MIFRLGGIGIILVFLVVLLPTEMHPAFILLLILTFLGIVFWSLKGSQQVRPCRDKLPLTSRPFPQTQIKVVRFVLATFSICFILVFLPVSQMVRLYATAGLLVGMASMAWWMVFNMLKYGYFPDSRVKGMSVRGVSRKNEPFQFWLLVSMYLLAGGGMLWVVIDWALYSNL